MGTAVRIETGRTIGNEAGVKQGRKRSTGLLRVAAAAAVVSALVVGPAHAQTFTNPAGGNWNAAGNWSSATVPASANTTALVFGGSTAYTATNDVGAANAAFLVNSLTFSNTFNGVGVTLDRLDTRIITLDGTAPALAQNGSSGVQVNSQVTLNVNGILVNGTGTGDLSLADVRHVTGNAWTTTLSGAFNVNVASYTKGQGNKTWTNNLAAGKTLTFGSVALNSGNTNNTWTVGGSAATVVTGAITQGGAVGNASLVKADAGTVTLLGANTYTGTLQVNNGTLEVASLGDSGAGSNGTGSIKILNGTNAAATLKYLGAGTTLTRAIDVFGTGTTAGAAIVDNSGTGPLTLGAASLSASGAAKSLQLQGSYAATPNVVAGVLSNGAGTLGVTKAGAGTWVLDAANTYSGPTVVTGGTLVQGASGAGAFGASNAFTATGGGTLDARAAGLNITAGGSLTAGKMTGTTGDVLGDVSLTGATLNVGGTAAAGTFTHAGNLTVNDGSTLRFDLAPTNTAGGGVNDLVAVNGNVTLNGTVGVNLNPLAGPLSTGTYTLLTYTGTLTGGAANLSAPTGSAGGRLSFGYDTATAGKVLLTVTGNAANLTWTGGAASGGTLWDAETTVNFTGAPDAKFYAGDTVNFTDAGAANNAVDLATALQPTAVVVNAAADYSFQGPGSIAGAATLTKSGTGMLTLGGTGANTYAGTTTVTGGTLALNKPAATDAIPG